MAVSNNLNNILERIHLGNSNDSDIKNLQQILQTGDRKTLQQLGKYNVKIGQGQDIQIGDRNYYSWSDEAIQALIEVVQQGSAVAVVNAQGNASIDQSHKKGENPFTPEELKRLRK